MKIRFLDLYGKEYKAFKTLERLPKKVLEQLGFLGGLEMSHYSQNKNLLAKGLYIRLGGYVPTNFNKW